MKLPLHRFGFLLGILWTSLAFGQQDSTLGLKNFDIGGLLLIAPSDPEYVLRGSREWKPDSLTLANGQMGNLSDLFREIPSIAVKRYAPGGLATPSLRGTGAGHTQIYWEGVPLNSPMLGQQDFALGAGGLFEKVAVRYGGGSLQDGSGGLGGSINLRSHHEFEDNPKFDLNLRDQIGSFRSNASNFDLALGNGNFSSVTKGYLNTARNNFPFQNITLPNSPIQRLQSAGNLQFGGMQEFKLVAGKNLIAGRVWLLNSDRLLPPTMLSQDAGEQQTDNAIRSMLQWTSFVLSRGKLDTKAAWFRESMLYLNELASIDAPSSFDRWVAQTDYDHFALTNHFALKGAGIRFVHDQASSQGYRDKAIQNNASAYAKGEFRIVDRSFLTMLLREEWNNQQFSPLLGYLGGTSDFGIRGVTVNANVSRNYRSPSLNDLYWIPGGNPNLRPEMSHAAEVSLGFQADQNRDHDYYITKKKWLLQTEIGAYYNNVTDWILWLPVSGAIWQPVNVQHVRAVGIETIVKKKGYFHNMRYLLNFNYTISSAKNQDGYQLIYTPKHNASIRLSLDWRKWSMQYFQDWNSRRFTTADNSTFIHGFTTGDISFGWRHVLSEKSHKVEYAYYEIRNLTPYHSHTIQLQAGVRNITNAQYQTVAWRPMPGRSIFVRVDLSLASGKPKKEK